MKRWTCSDEKRRGLRAISTELERENAALRPPLSAAPDPLPVLPSELGQRVTWVEFRAISEDGPRGYGDEPGTALMSAC